MTGLASGSGSCFQMRLDCYRMNRCTSRANLLLTHTSLEVHCTPGERGMAKKRKKIISNRNWLTNSSDFIFLPFPVFAYFIPITASIASFTPCACNYKIKLACCYILREQQTGDRSHACTFRPDLRASCPSRCSWKRISRSLKYLFIDLFYFRVVAIHNMVK